MENQITELQYALDTFYFLVMGALVMWMAAGVFYALYLFSTAFYDLRMGYASAMAWILFLLIAGLTLIATRVARRRIHYST